MPSLAVELALEHGLEPPLQGTVESWLLDTMDLPLAYHIVTLTVQLDIPLVVALQSMLKPTRLPTQPDTVLLLRAPHFTLHIFRALAVLN